MFNYSKNSPSIKKKNSLDLNEVQVLSKPQIYSSTSKAILNESLKLDETTVDDEPVVFENLIYDCSNV
jgi:hypothetical protein